MAKKNTYTPMMAQYIEMKKKHQDEIVFYRLGDFYEMFFDDAKIASQELDLVLTGKNAGVEEKVPMCGIPHHAANGYIQRLIQKGYKVAIVEQMENPATAKGIVKRDVLKIVTPGTIMDEVNDEKTTVYIASLYDYQFGLAVVLCEMTTGEIQAQLIDKQVMAIQKLLLGNNVAEVVVQEKFDKKIIKMINDMNQITVSYDNNANIKAEYEHLIHNIEDERIRKAFGILTNYLDETQRRNMAHLHHVEQIYEDEFLQMDYNTKQNLELTTCIRNNSKSLTLWNFLDKCRSSMGSRLLKKWIEYPLVDINLIHKRQDAIEFMNDNFITKDELKEHLSYVYDMERLSARVAYGSANPRDILRLIKTLEHAPMIFELFKNCEAYSEFKNIDLCQDLYELINGAIVENPPITLKDGGIFVKGYNEELDHVREIGKNGKNWILNLENKERERTGVKSLKIGYNRVFGYYIEITKANLDQIKEEYGYIRKQTLTNAERFITQELKEQEDEIIHAQERSIRLENELFDNLLNIIKEYLPKLHDLSNALSTIDALYALAEISSENGYTRPYFHNEHKVNIEEGRHPILDKIMKTTRYVSNDVIMNNDEYVMLITGPNMGGKSTYMRQMALIVIMAQIGCYVPARKAEFPIFDKIFTRIGASDDIMSGQSTFMVEMMEANNALKNATENSLVLFDEIGRGTSTYDGMALAQAMIEYIVYNIKAKTLFSTHYHELTDMEAKIPGILNVHVDVHEEDEKVTFLYRVIKGKADKSYGINVARLAHLPNTVLDRAQQILDHLEMDNNPILNVENPVIIEQENSKYEDIVMDIKNVDINKMTPIEAMQFIYELKQKVN